MWKQVFPFLSRNQGDEFYLLEQQLTRMERIIFSACLCLIPPIVFYFAILFLISPVHFFTDQNASIAEALIEIAALSLTLVKYLGERARKRAYALLDTQTDSVKCILNACSLYA